MALASVGKLHSKRNTAKMLNISVATLDRRIADGSINYYKQGFRIAFSDSQIEEYLEHCLNAPRQREHRKTSRRVQKAA